MDVEDRELRAAVEQAPERGGLGGRRRGSAARRPRPRRSRALVRARSRRRRPGPGVRARSPRRRSAGPRRAAQPARASAAARARASATRGRRAIGGPGCQRRRPGVAAAVRRRPCATAAGRAGGADWVGSCRCGVASPSRATSRCRSRGRACRTASTARSPRTGPHLHEPDEVERLIDRAARRGVKELLVLTGDDPASVPGVRERLAELGFDDFVAYVVWCCERALERGLLPHTNLGALGARGPRAPARGDRVAGADARVDAPGPRRAPGLADEGPGAAAADDPRRGRAADPVHERDPRRDRRDARTTASRRSRRSPPSTPSTATCRR